MVAQMKLKINQFTKWNLQELKEWCEVYSSTLFLQTTNNIDTYLEVVEELNKRDGFSE